ncbi:MAG: hypothetical protein ACETWG_10555 [Candidatus Neomarinimicrobiota bacterium]
MRWTGYLLLLLLLSGCVDVEELEYPTGNPFDPADANYAGLEFMDSFTISKGSLEPKAIAVSGEDEIYLSWGAGGFIEKYSPDGELLAELEIRDSYDQIVGVQSLHLIDNELYILAPFNEADEDGNSILVQKYSLDLQLVSKVGIPNLRAEEYGGENDVGPILVHDVDPQGNYYVTYASRTGSSDLLKLFVRVCDNSGNVVRDFIVDTTGIGIAGDLFTIMGISVNQANEKYFKLLWNPPLGGNAIRYTVKYDTQDAREKYWEFGWTGGGSEYFDRLAFTTEGYICTSTWSGDLEVWNDEERLQEIPMSDFNLRFARFGIAGAKTEKRLYAIASEAYPTRYHVMIFRYYW